VVVSWWNAHWDSRRLGVENVVLHEFAHVLGFRFNPREGIPEPEESARFAPWRRMILREFRQLREDVLEGRETLLDAQGTENLAEFFAVGTECFFLQAGALRAEHLRLYEALAGWYRQDPARRREPTDDEWVEMERTEHEYDAHTIEECGVLLRRNPDDVDAYFNRAAAYQRQGRYAEAVTDYDAILRLDARDADGWHERGAARLKLGQLEQAIADCSEAIRLDPNFWEAYDTRAEAHAAKGEEEKAEADRAEAKRLRDQES
jgi:tetratricopeptide (TPR) repeat protein